MKRLFTLRDVGTRDRDRFGGKAVVLAQLLDAGVRVAPGVVIPAEMLDRFLAEQGWSERALARDSTLADDIRGARLPKALAEDLRREVVRLGPRVVVRSSGVDEDGDDASWAGQYDTVVGVEPGAPTERAVLQCWASAFEARVEAYARDRVQGEAVGLAVLIQALIEPRCAGVMFTVNPMSGSWREMTIEAAWGQAESVVRGIVIPDYYVVRRPRRVPRPVQRVLARVQLDVVEDMVRHQDTALRVGPDGLVETPVPAARIEAPKLRHAELYRLCRLGLRLEAMLGGPQDIEWALEEDGSFVVLQARPVTTRVGVRRSGPALWTRRFVGERWTEPATPLGWSLMGSLFDSFVAYPDTQERWLGGGAATQLFRFAPYMNVTAFRHLSFKLPGAPPPRFMMELLPPEEERGWVRRRAQAPDMRVYASILAETIRDRRWSQFAWNPWTNHRQWAGFQERMLATLPQLDVPGASPGEALERAGQCRELAGQYIGIHICSLLFANLLFQACEGALLARGEVQLAADVLRPIEESWTVRTNQALWKLGRDEITRDAFLADFGHRATNSWELFSPRWREEPARVDVLAAAAAQHADPGAMAARQVERARIACDGLTGWLRSLVELTQHYLLLRENQRYCFDQLLWAWKVQLLALETSFGVPIRFLEASELEDLVGGILTLEVARGRIEQREAAWNEEVARRASGDEPPTFFVGSEEVALEAAARRLSGLGTSPGVVTGRVRVLRSPDEAALLQPGEILVARATDPGWTPLFLKAGGLVVEIGGMLSHGAVVAREYGLPAVANVSGATAVLEDGQMVTLDGRRGVVWLR